MREQQFSFSCGNVNNISLVIRTENGEFNIPMTKNKDCFEVTKILKEGQYMYKYFVEGIVKLNDPNAVRYVVDSTGEVWSFLYVSENIDITKNI